MKIKFVISLNNYVGLDYAPIWFTIHDLPDVSVTGYYSVVYRMCINFVNQLNDMNARNK